MGIAKNHWSKKPLMKAIVLKKISESHKGKKMPESHRNSRKEYMLKAWKENREEMIQIVRKGSKKLIGRTHTEEARRKIRIARAKQKMKPLSEEHKRKFCYTVRKLRKGKTFEEVFGKEKAKRIKEKLKDVQGKENNPFYGRKHTSESLTKMRLAKLGKSWEEQFGEEKAREAKLKVSKRMKENKWWRLSRKNRIRPTKPESIVKFYSEFHKLGYRYNDGKRWFGNCNPDFVNEKQKKIIEVYGNYWHRNDDPNKRINYFKKYGYDCLVLWESEILKKDFEERIIRFTFDEYESNEIRNGKLIHLIG